MYVVGSVIIILLFLFSVWTEIKKMYRYLKQEKPIFNEVWKLVLF